ncbi:hypothetical protein DFJ74DRAFT_764747 [Hyaloraphidium curvatum]|nr:hypothetical protein DFJ74DRAFT_764747 [Hyaloraphidium curvatum]
MAGDDGLNEILATLQGKERVRKRQRPSGTGRIFHSRAADAELRVPSCAFRGDFFSAARVSKNQAEKAAKLKIECDKVLNNIQVLAVQITEKHEREVTTKISEFQTKMEELFDERMGLLQKLKTESDKFNIVSENAVKGLGKATQSLKKVDSDFQKGVQSTVKSILKEHTFIADSLDEQKRQTTARAGDRNADREAKADAKEEATNAKKRKSNPLQEALADLLTDDTAKPRKRATLASDL